MYEVQVSQVPGREIMCLSFTSCISVVTNVTFARRIGKRTELASLNILQLFTGLRKYASILALDVMS